MLSSKSIKCPIGTVSYDVLLEIFTHCLPQDRFERPQHFQRIAPMLFCQICSSWRTVALAAPTLWSHLRYYLIVWDDNGGVGSWQFLEGQIAFLRWWTRNLGSMAPFLRLDFVIHTSEADPEVSLAEGGMDFVVNFITSAQHLEIEPSFWAQVQIMSNVGHYITFPNLHTLVTYQSPYAIYNYFLPTQIVIGRASEDIPSVLRRIAIIDLTNISFRSTTIPAQWSTLTHLSITVMRMPYDFWVHLTSALPCLQWACVSFIHWNTLDADKRNNPIKRTLPQLSTLFIISSTRSLFNTLFVGLHLPALNDLFLVSHMGLDPWWDHRGMTDIDTVLRSAPALQNLTLRKYTYLFTEEIDYATGTNAAVDDIVPIWRCTPHLAHLRLELLMDHFGDTEIDAVDDLETFAHSAFCCNNRWLDFDNPACPIKTFEVSDGKSTTANIRKRIGNASNIAFHLISQQFTHATDLWMEWRSRN